MNFIGDYKNHLDKTWRDHDHFFTFALAAASFLIILLYPPFQQFLLRSSGSYAIYMIVMAIMMGAFVYVLERLLS